MSNIFLLRTQDSNSGNQSLPGTHLAGPGLGLSGFDCLVICKLMWQRLGLLKFPQLCLDLFKAALFVQCRVFPFIPSSRLAACLNRHHCWKQMQCSGITPESGSGSRRAESGLLEKANQKTWQGLPRPSDTAEAKQGFEEVPSQPPGAVELPRMSTGQAQKPQSPSLDA